MGKGRATNNRTATSVDEEIGRRIRLRRLDLEMSQENLADKLGVTFQQVQKYEKGVNRVAAATLMRIAKILDLPIAAFFPKETADAKSLADTPEDTELQLVVASLSERSRRLLLETAKLYQNDERAAARPERGAKKKS